MTFPHQPTPEPTHGPPSDGVISPDGTQWYDAHTRTWQLIPQPIPASTPTPLPRPAPANNNRGALIALGVVLLGAVAYWTLPPLFAGDERLSEANRDCSAGSLGDDGRSLRLDGEGERKHSGDVTFDSHLCVRAALAVPDSTWTKMLETTSLQGRQTDSWDGIHASWMYHPDHGLDIIYELSK